MNYAVLKLFAEFYGIFFFYRLIMLLLNHTDHCHNVLLLKIYFIYL